MITPPSGPRWMMAIELLVKAAFLGLVTFGFLCGAMTCLRPSPFEPEGMICFRIVIALFPVAFGIFFGRRCYFRVNDLRQVLKGEMPASTLRDVEIQVVDEPISKHPFLNALLVLFGFAMLSASALPMFDGLLRKSNEGASKGNLGSIRSALSLYYKDTGGQYPAELASLTIGGKYLTLLPRAKAPNYHQDSDAVQSMTANEFKEGKFTDKGGWAYVFSGSTDVLGTVVVNCTHTDTRARVWTSY